LLYMEDIKSCNFYFDNGTTKNNKTTYAPFYNEVTFSGNRYSLSFGEEKSVLDDTVLLNGLFKIYYNSYLSNLFNPKCNFVVKWCIRCFIVLSRSIVVDYKIKIE